MQWLSMKTNLLERVSMKSIKNSNDERLSQESNDQTSEPLSDTKTHSSSIFKKWLKPNTPSEIVRRFVRIERSHTSHSGLIPSLSELSRYEELVPGAADRIITLAENTQKTQEKAITGHIRLARLRIVTSSIISGLMIAAAGLSIIFYSTWLAIPLGSIGVGLLLLQDLSRRVRN